MGRVARIGKNDKYKLKVDEYRKEKKQEALDYSAPARGDVHSCGRGRVIRRGLFGARPISY